MTVSVLWYFFVLWLVGLQCVIVVCLCNTKVVQTLLKVTLERHIQSKSHLIN